MFENQQKPFQVESNLDNMKLPELLDAIKGNHIELPYFLKSNPYNQEPGMLSHELKEKYIKIKKSPSKNGAFSINTKNGILKVKEEAMSMSSVIIVYSEKNEVKVFTADFSKETENSKESLNLAVCESPTGYNIQAVMKRKTQNSTEYFIPDFALIRVKLDSHSSSNNELTFSASYLKKFNELSFTFCYEENSATAITSQLKILILMLFYGKEKKQGGLFE